jgi:hypothetical protein
MPHFLKQEIHIKFTILQDYSQRSGESSQPEPRGVQSNQDRIVSCVQQSPTQNGGVNGLGGQQKANDILQFVFKNGREVRHQWLMPIIPAT